MEKIDPKTVKKDGVLLSIKVAFSHHRTYPLPEHLSNEAGRLNVLSTIDHILSSSQIIRELVNKKKIKIVGTFYDLHTGKVELLQP